MSESSSQRWWIVRRSSIHQRGIFARRDIPKETPVIEYIGEKITKANSLSSAILKHNPLDKVSLKVMRGGQTIALDAILGERE